MMFAPIHKLCVESRGVQYVSPCLPPREMIVAALAAMMVESDYLNRLLRVHELVVHNFCAS